MWTLRSLLDRGPLYLALADQIAEDVAAGRLTPGTRLPPQRHLAARLGVDLTTVTRAYAEATRRGLIAGHVGRGTFVRAGAAATRPRTRAARASRVAPSEPLHVDLSRNIAPRLDPDPAAESLAATLAAYARRPDLDALLMRYEPNAGREADRAAGATWLATRGLDASPDRVIVSAGAQHALAVVFGALAASGDVVLAESLTYPGFRAVAAQLGLAIEGLPMDDEGIVVDAFAAACRSGRARLLYCMPTLHNPTAASMSPSRRREIARIATRYDVTIVEDDVYGTLGRDAPPPLATFAPERSYVVTSLSKAVAPGLRIGYVLAPDAASAERVATAVHATMWMAPPLLSEIASGWIADGTALRVLDARRAEARLRQRVARRVMRDLDWRADPEGYHGWLQLPDAWSSAEFVGESRRAGVALTPGDAFAVAAGGRPAVRVGLGSAQDAAALEDALTRLRRILERAPGAGAPVV
jgi:DNA-binding transcriptional MocR family regulator